MNAEEKGTILIIHRWKNRVGNVRRSMDFGGDWMYMDERCDGKKDEKDEEAKDVGKVLGGVGRGGGVGARIDTCLQGAGPAFDSSSRHLFTWPSSRSNFTPDLCLSSSVAVISPRYLLSDSSDMYHISISGGMALHLPVSAPCSYHTWTSKKNDKQKKKNATTLPCLALPCLAFPCLALPLHHVPTSLKNTYVI